MPTTIDKIQAFAIKVDDALQGQRGLDTKKADPDLLDEGLTLIANAEPKITFDVIDKKTAKAIPEGTLAYLARIRFLLKEHAEHLKQSQGSDTPAATAADMPSVAVAEEQPTVAAAGIQSVETTNTEDDLAKIDALIKAFQGLPKANNKDYKARRNALIAENKDFLEQYEIVDTDPNEIIKQLKIVISPPPQVSGDVAPLPPPPRMSTGSGNSHHEEMPPPPPPPESEAQVTLTPIKIKREELIPQIEAFIANVQNSGGVVNTLKWAFSYGGLTTDPTEALKDRGNKLLAQIGYRAETDIDVKEMARRLGNIKDDIEEEEGVREQAAQQTPVDEQLTGEQLATGRSSQAEDEDEDEEEEQDDKGLDEELEEKAQDIEEEIQILTAQLSEFTGANTQNPVKEQNLRTRGIDLLHRMEIDVDDDQIPLQDLEQALLATIEEQDDEEPNEAQQAAPHQTPTPPAKGERARAPAQPGSTKSRYVLLNPSGYFKKKPLYRGHFLQSRNTLAQAGLRPLVKKPTPPKTPAPKSQVLTDALTTDFQSKMQTFAYNIPKVKQLLGVLEKITDLPTYMQKVIQISSVINNSTSLTDTEKKAANELVALHNAALLQSQIHRLESITTSLRQALANPNPTGQDYSNLATLTHQVHYELDELRRVLTVGLSSYPEFRNVNNKINQIMKELPSRRRAVLVDQLKGLFTPEIRQRLQSKSNDLSVTGVNAIVLATDQIVQAEGAIALHRKPQESAQAQNTTGSRLPNLRGMANSAVQFGSGLTASAAPYVSGAATKIRTKAEQVATRAQRLVVTDRSTLEEKVYNIIIQTLEAYAKLESTSAANKQDILQYIANDFSGPHALPPDLAEQIKILKGITDNPELTKKAYADVINLHLDDLQKKINAAQAAIGKDEFEACYVYANKAKEAIEQAILDPEIALANSPTNKRLQAMAAQLPKLEERDRAARERVGAADMAVVDAGSNVAAMKFSEIERDLTRVKFDSSKANFDDYMQAIGSIDHAITEIAKANAALYQVISHHNLNEAQLSNAKSIAATMASESVALPKIRTNITKALEDLKKDKATPPKLKSALTNALKAKLAVVDLQTQALNYEASNPGIKEQAAKNDVLYNATKELESATTAANAIKKISAQNMIDAERALAEIEAVREKVLQQVILAGISIPDADHQPFNQDILELATNRTEDIPYGWRINQTSEYRGLLDNNRIANNPNYNPFVKHLLTTLAKAQVAAFDLEYRILLVNPSIQYINFLASQFTATPQPTKEQLVKVRYALEQALKNYAKIHGNEVQDPQTAQAIKDAQDKLQQFIDAEAPATTWIKWPPTAGIRMRGFPGFGRGKKAGAEEEEEEEDDAISLTDSDSDAGLDLDGAASVAPTDVEVEIDTPDPLIEELRKRQQGLGLTGAPTSRTDSDASTDAGEEDEDEAEAEAEAEDATADHNPAKPTATGTTSKATDLRTAFREVCKEMVDSDPDGKYKLTKGYVFGRTPPLTLKHNAQEKITLNAPRKIGGIRVTKAELYKGETDSWTVLLESMKRSKNKHCTFSLGIEGDLETKAAQFLMALMEVEKPLNNSELSFSFRQDDPTTKQAIFDALKKDEHKDAREFFGMKIDLDSNGRLQKLEGSALATAKSKNVNLFFSELRTQNAHHHGPGAPV